MNHQYITTSKLKKSIHFITDCAVDIFVKLFAKIEDVQIKNPPKILFFSLGHLGDALILSYLFPLIKEFFPSTSIDVVVPEWSADILKNNPYVNKIIIHNTFHQNRREKNFFQKVRLQYGSLKNVVKKLKEQDYDISFEGRISYPNGNRIAYKSDIKKRVGFGSGGFGSLLTNEVKFPEGSSFHLLEALLKELEIVGIKKRISDIIPYFNYNVKTLLKLEAFQHNNLFPFLILHFETGNPNRNVNRDFLIKIVKKIIEETKFNLLLCGITEESQQLYNILLETISDRNNRITNSVNKYSLDEFFILSKYASAAITLESLPAHLCAINCRTISLYNNGSGALYFPISNNVSTVIHNHTSSRLYKTSKNIKNYYVRQIDSTETLLIIGQVLKELSII